MRKQTTGTGFRVCANRTPLTAHRSLKEVFNINNWYAVNTKPKNEDLACALLGTHSIEVYLPMLEADASTRRRSAKKKEPLFPGYMFVKIDLERPGWEKIKYTPGVRTIVSYGSQPVVVPDPVIDEIREKLGHDDFAPGKIVPFETGDKVQFKSGPFEGLEGIFTGTVSGSQRVKILMELLRQPVHVDAEIECLERIEETVDRSLKTGNPGF